MPSHFRDRIAGAVLFAAALVWVGLVYWTIPPGQEGTTGPRAFPLFFGLALAGFSALLVLLSLRRDEPLDQREQTGGDGEVFSVLATIAALLAYAFLMERIGFLLATAIIVAGIAIFILRLRRPVLILCMACSMSLGCYVVFGKLLGTYLPPGTWISLYF